MCFWLKLRTQTFSPLALFVQMYSLNDHKSRNRPITDSLRMCRWTVRATTTAKLPFDHRTCNNRNNVSRVFCLLPSTSLLTWLTPLKLCQRRINNNMNTASIRGGSESPCKAGSDLIIASVCWQCVWSHVWRVMNNVVHLIFIFLFCFTVLKTFQQRDCVESVTCCWNPFSFVLSLLEMFY